MQECDLLYTVQNLFTGFNQFTQIIFGFALGLAFSQANITVGWIFFWIVVWELGTYLLFANSIYYDPFFRVAYNCVFLLSILIGQYLYFGQTTFQNFLYPNSITTKKAFNGSKYEVMNVVEKYLDEYMENEDKKVKQKKKAKVKNFFLI
jgi:hypothetical protein